MSNCCNDPTEPTKIDQREILRLEEQYGNLLRDLFTGDPEKLIIKKLNSANTYLRELAALRAFYPAARMHAITLLDKESSSILLRIIETETNMEIVDLARKRFGQLNKKTGKKLADFFKN